MATDPEVTLLGARMGLRRITLSNLPEARGGHHPRKPTPWIGRSRHTVGFVRSGARLSIERERKRWVDGLWPSNGLTLVLTFGGRDRTTPASSLISPSKCTLGPRLVVVSRHGEIHRKPALPER